MRPEGKKALMARATRIIANDLRWRPMDVNDAPLKRS
jgi:hypothetical protein